MSTIQTKSTSYDDFVDKFTPKLTTDDCYTPAAVYNKVALFVASTYDVPVVSNTSSLYHTTRSNL